MRRCTSLLRGFRCTFPSSRQQAVIPVAMQKSQQDHQQRQGRAPGLAEQRVRSHLCRLIGLIVLFLTGPLWVLVRVRVMSPGRGGRGALRHHRSTTRHEVLFSHFWIDRLTGGTVSDFVILVRVMREQSVNSVSRHFESIYLFQVCILQYVLCSFIVSSSHRLCVRSVLAYMWVCILHFVLCLF
jgi:hypothetical protein